MVDESGIGPNFVEWCANTAKTTKLYTLNHGDLVVISTDDECDDLSNSNSTDNGGGYTCPPGQIFKNGFCCELKLLCLLLYSIEKYN